MACVIRRGPVWLIFAALSAIKPVPMCIALKMRSRTKLCDKEPECEACVIPIIIPNIALQVCILVLFIAWMLHNTGETQDSSVRPGGKVAREMPTGALNQA